MSENVVYFWTDRPERAYVTLRTRGSHWLVEWGYRDPPGGPNYLERGHHETSVQEDAVRRMLAHIRELSSELDDAQRIEPELRAALEEAKP